MKDFYRTDDEQIPLFCRLNTRPRWRDVQDALCMPKKTHAPIALAFYDHYQTGNYTSYSRRHDRGGMGDCNGILTRSNVVGAIDWMDAQGLIEHHRQCEGGRGWRSAARANRGLLDPLRQIIPFASELPLAQLERLIEVREKNGKLAKPSRSVIDRLERPLAAYNDLISGSEILAGNKLDIRCASRRIFNGDMGNGGRVFTVGGTSHQNMPSDQRHDITINGEPTVELDFKAIHPHLLYVLEGYPVPSDCYDIGTWPRDLVKLALLVLINAEKLLDVIGVIANSDGDKVIRDRDGCIVDVTTERRLMKQIAGDNYGKASAFAHRLINDVKARHDPISRHFHSGAGLWLMNRDSEIAMDVIRVMTATGEPVLAIHDSFRSRESASGKLEEVMHQAAEQFGVGGIKIERKSRH